MVGSIVNLLVRIGSEAQEEVDKFGDADDLHILSQKTV